MRSATVLSRGSTIQTAGNPSSSVRAEPGTSITVAGGRMTRPVTVAPNSISDGGSVSAIRTGIVRVAGSACGAISEIRPLAAMFWFSLSATSTGASRASPRMSITCGGT